MEGRNPDKFKLSQFALRIFKDLYLFPDETITGCFHRVAGVVGNTEEEKNEAFELLKNNIWRVSTPTFINAGTDHFMPSACWITDLEDSMDSIYEVANIARKIFQHGAGIGIPIGNLRETDADIFEGKDKETSTPFGKSSGPVSFMHLFDAVGATTKSGGRARRAAIMCVMPVSHPNIENFITCKEVDGSLSNMNISVAITDKFMQAFKDNIPFDLISPSTKKIVKQVNARQLWDNIVDSAWKTADPGIIFIDTVNKFNMMKSRITISATNPCVTGDTIVYTNFGKITVRELVDNFDDNTLIMSYDVENNNTTWDIVQWCGLTKNDAEIIELELEDGTILKLTPDHKVFTENRGYIEACDLNTDDVILKLQNN